MPSRSPRLASVLLTATAVLLCPAAARAATEGGSGPGDAVRPGDALRSGDAARPGGARRSDGAARAAGVPQVVPTLGTGAVVPAGTATTLTITVVNSDDLEAKPAWSFDLRLPAGLRVAPSGTASTSCTGGTVTASGGVIHATGETPAAEPSCAIRVVVVADAPGTYRSAPEDVLVSDGLRPPSKAAELVVGPAVAAEVPPAGPGVADVTLPPPIEGAPPDPPAPGPPAAAPSRPVADALLRVAVSSSTSRVRAGRTVRLRVTARNASAYALTQVDVCLRLPIALTYVPRPATGVRIGDRRCWTARRIAPGASRTYALNARASRPTRTATVRGRATAAEALGTTTADRPVRVTR